MAVTTGFLIQSNDLVILLANPARRSQSFPSAFLPGVVVVRIDSFRLPYDFVPVSIKKCPAQQHKKCPRTKGGDTGAGKATRRRWLA